jgi:hypothetical protein
LERATWGKWMAQLFSLGAHAKEAYPNENANESCMLILTSSKIGMLIDIGHK